MIPAATETLSERTGPVKSLNVSVATGVVLFEALRQRHSKRNQ